MSTADPPPAAIALTRAQVLGYRAAVHHLQRPARDPMADGVLLAGVQDYPPGRTAGVALRVRGAKVDAARLVLLHSLRAAPHLHRATDIGCVAAALRTLEVTDLAKEQFGPFAQELAGQGISLGWAMDHVAEAMRQACADGRPLTKGELSAALIELVDARLRPWCPGCAAHHVQDVLFRYATLQAGLAIAVQPTGFQYVQAPGAAPPSDPVERRSCGASSDCAARADQSTWPGGSRSAPLPPADSGISSTTSSPRSPSTGDTPGLTTRISRNCATHPPPPKFGCCHRMTRSPSWPTANSSCPTAHSATPCGGRSAIPAFCSCAERSPAPTATTPPHTS
jgi:hypothetical protein